MDTAKTVGSGVQTPFCGDLRSKKYYLMDGIPTKAEEYLDPSNHCWCRVTQLVVGPDDSKAGPEYCRPGRKCYKSALPD